MINRKSAVVNLFGAAIVVGVSVGLAFGNAGEAAAQPVPGPYPGCPFEIPTTYNVCSKRPGVPGFTPGFTLTEGVPGTWGPQGIYTPRRDPSY